LLGTPYLLSLGLSKSLMSLVWLAGPLSGKYFLYIFLFNIYIYFFFKKKLYIFIYVNRSCNAAVSWTTFRQFNI